MSALPRESIAPAVAPTVVSTPAIKAAARNFNFHYGDFHALKNINLPVYDKKVTAMIGPSGCGKSTFLRSFNRMHDLYPGQSLSG